MKIIHRNYIPEIDIYLFLLLFRIEDETRFKFVENLI